MGKQDVNWKYAKTIRNKYGYKASYEHMCDRVEIKKNFRDADGAVITEPRNFTTKPSKKGSVGPGTFFGPYPEHIKCEYDGGREERVKEMKLHQEKMRIDDRRPFSARAKSSGYFNSVK